MINIEIFGFRAVSAAKLRQRIARILKEKDRFYFDDVEFTTHTARVTDKNGSEKQFLRLASANENYMFELFELLKHFNIRIERIKLEAFQ